VPKDVRDLFDNGGRLMPGVDTEPIRDWLRDHVKQAGLDGNSTLGDAENGYNNVVDKRYGM
jgi:hypothetical protein